MHTNASATTQATYVNRGPSIYSPLTYMDRAGTKSCHLFNHLGTTLALASAARERPASASGEDSARKADVGVQSMGERR